MSSAGRYPIVRGGAVTLTRFFEVVQNRPVPSSPVSWQQWLRLQSLTSSYFDDCIPFVKFVGLIDGKGATDLWLSLREDGEFANRLASAIKTGYAPLLVPLGIEDPASADRDKLSQAIFSTENTDRDKARAGAETLLAAFDVALGRSSAPNKSTDGKNAAKAIGFGRRASGTPAVSRKESTTASQNGELLRTDVSTGQRRPLSLAVNLQIVLPPDASDARYDAILGAVAKHLGSLL